MSYKVVIIDDEHWTREVIKGLVEWNRLDLSLVGESSDGDFGLELIEKFNPDIIITDVAMPNMNGLELVQRLRSKGNRSEIVIVSGYDDFKYIHSAMKLEVSDYLLKPIKPDELNEQLSACIHKLDTRDRVQNNPYEISATGFLEFSWADQFYVLKNKAYEYLYSCDINSLIKVFSELDTQLGEHGESTCSKSAMIYIYFVFMGQLQHFISEKGFTIHDFNSAIETPFVFNHDSTISQMLIFICNQYCKVSKEVHHLIKTKNRLDIGLIKRYIEEHFTESITLEQTAARFYVSKEYLSKVFKAEVGIGFADYIASLRMEKAKKLILEQKVPIKDVGYMVGYLEQTHFYKKFKHYFSMTPGEMRQTLKNDNQSQ